MNMNDRHFTNFHIAGFSYYDGVDVFCELKIGTELKLIAEPENHYDTCAVAVYYQDTKLGYIPKEKNGEIFKFLQLGYTDLFEAKINQMNKETHPEKQVGVLVRIRKKGTAE